MGFVRMLKFPSLALAATLLAGPALATELGVGRPALPAEIAAWDIDARPDGQGLPAGQGSVKQGEALYLERCAACHGEFGEGAGKFPELAGGAGSLRQDRPFKTVGSYWPYATTAFDYIRRSMPFGQAQSLQPNEIYALTAYILNLNDIVADDFVASQGNLAAVRMPNAKGFYDDDREAAERGFWNAAPCMSDCKPPARVTSRASAVDVTPDSKTTPKME
jgi:mono/diheme cytochrome c family protein